MTEMAPSPASLVYAGETLASKKLTQLLALDELHRDEVNGIDFVDLVNSGDVGMVDRSGRFRQKRALRDASDISSGGKTLSATSLSSLLSSTR